MYNLHMRAPHFVRILPPAFLICAVAALSACGDARRADSTPRQASTPNASNAAASNQSGTSETTAEGLPQIVAFGDSLTASYGLAPKESYPALLQKMVDGEGVRQASGAQ